MVWVYIWLGIVCASMLVEFITKELISVWIAIGSLIALILAAFGVSYIIQLVVAIVISISCIIALRKPTVKFLSKNNNKTNLDLIVGKKAKLLTSITKDEMGSLKHNGVTYSASTENEEEINKGEYVVIQKIEGNKLVVTKFN